MKKEAFSITQKDRDLLIFLAGLVIAFLLYYFVTAPLMAKGRELKAKAETVNAEYARMDSLADNLSTLESDENKKTQEILEKYKVFFYELSQDRLLYQIDTYITESGMTVTDYLQSEGTVDSISVPESVYSYNEYPLLKKAKDANPDLDEKGQVIQKSSGSSSTASSQTLADDAVPCIEITLKFNSTTYSALMSFIGKLEGMQKAVIIKNLNISKSGTALSGEMVLSLYSMPKVDESEKDYLKFIPSAGTGKSDPFQ